MMNKVIDNTAKNLIIISRMANIKISSWFMWNPIIFWSFYLLFIKYAEIFCFILHQCSVLKSITHIFYSSLLMPAFYNSSYKVVVCCRLSGYVNVEMCHTFRDECQTEWSNILLSILSYLRRSCLFLLLYVYKCFHVFVQ